MPYFSLLGSLEVAQTVPPLYIPDSILPKSDQKQTKFHSKSDLNQTKFDLFPDQIKEKQTINRTFGYKTITQQFYLPD